MASLSEKLRRERELRGISLRQISEDTKIGVRFLEALEEDRLELIPGEFYRRSYLRAYARYLGLDEDRAVNAYAFSQDKSPESEMESAPRDAAISSWIVWSVLAALLLIATIFVLRSQSELSPEPVATPEPVASSTRRQSPSEQVSAPAVPAASVPVLSGPDTAREGVQRDIGNGALRFVVAVEESCWLEIQADGEVVITGLKEEGYRREFAANEEVRLWLGNAGGVSFWINGRAVKPLGRAGQVRKDLAITPENVMEFVRDDVS